ncbi:MAG: hypothetical protein JRG76_15130 [Deltaproteobacteria bacterium]|nr:hypothetical protein [Deltaproteobacteria bacterium]MBW2415835.1 hypothetical protein [Deltaproteobacteria bacterium]
MAASQNRDRRLKERDLRKGVIREGDLNPDPSDLPDLSDNAEFPSDESLAGLAQDFEAQKVARDLRIERSIAEPPPAEMPIQPPPIPFDVE